MKELRISSVPLLFLDASVSLYVIIEYYEIIFTASMSKKNNKKIKIEVL